jgi:hypothetical protein
MKQPFPANFRTLKEALVDWVDADVATYYLACSLGLMGPEDGSFEEFRGAKHVFWSANQLGDALGRFMDTLVECGVLEFAGTGNMPAYRWNSSFKGDWET